MYLLRSLAIAISMYSKIPVPMVDWNEKNMKYAMCFFPVVERPQEDCSFLSDIFF